MPKFKPNNYDIISILIENEFASSRSDARRTVEQGGVKINGVVVKDLHCVVSSGSILQKGKIKFVEIL